MQLLEDMLPPEQYEMTSSYQEQDLSYQLHASLHHVTAAYQAAAVGSNTGQPLSVSRPVERVQQHNSKRGRKRQHRQRHEPFFPQHPGASVGNHRLHHELFQPGLSHLGNPEGHCLDAVAAPQLCSLESLQEPSTYGAYGAVYAAMAACCTAAATALPPDPDPNIDPTGHITGLQMTSTSALSGADCEGQVSAVLPPPQPCSLSSMRPPSLCLNMVPTGMSAPGYAAIPETGSAMPAAAPAHLHGQPQASSLECDISNIPVTPNGMFLMDLPKQFKENAWTPAAAVASHPSMTLR